MREVKATDAKARLAELLRAAEHGEAITITRHGKPVAHLVPAEAQNRANRKRAVEEVEALVPQLWHVEIRNAFLMAERRGRLSGRSVDERLDLLNGLPIRTDNEPDLQSAFGLARAHSLTVYDAIYLELAKRQSAELATLDRALGRAAIAEGVALLAP